jgi:hypothetical protein
LKDSFASQRPSNSLLTIALVGSLLALSGIALLGAVPAAHASPTLVGSNTSWCNGCSSVSATVSVGSPGQVLVVELYDSSSLTHAVTDTFSSTFTSAVSTPEGTGVLQVLTASAAGSGPDTVTASIGGGGSPGLSLYVYVVSGVTVSGAQTTSGGGLSCSTPPSGCTTDYSTSPITPASGSFVTAIVLDRSSPSSFTPGAGFTGVASGDFFSTFSEYQFSSGASTTFPASGTCSFSCMADSWSELGIALPPAPTVVGGVPEFPLGFALLVALALPLVLLARRWTLAEPRFRRAPA